MKSKLWAIVITIFMVFTWLPVTALAVPEDPVVPFDGDIWVYDGGFLIWDSQDLDTDGEIDSDDFSLYLADLTDGAIQPIDESSPLTSGGAAINRDLYVLDDTELYFGSLDLGTGGVYSFGEVGSESDSNVDIEGGTLRAAKIDVGGWLWIDTPATVIVTGDMMAGTEIESYGSIIDVGGSILAPEVWFDSDEGPLYVTVHDSIVTGNFDHFGGSVTVDGSIQAEYYTEVSNDYANYNVTELTVGGDITVIDTDGNDEEEYDGGHGYIEIGYSENDTFARAAVDDFSEPAKKDHSDSLQSGAELQSRLIEPSNHNILVNVAGDITAEQEIAIFRGTVTAGGVIQTLNQEDRRTIYIFGGTVNAGEMVSATEIIIGDEYDYFRTNDDIIVNVADDMTAEYVIAINGGRVTVGGVIQTLNAAGLKTIYINGGTVNAGQMVSATAIIIGNNEYDDFETNGEIVVRVQEDVTAIGDIRIYGGVVYADSVSCGEDFLIVDSATLFDAVNVGEAYPSKDDENLLLLYRTTLTGLIPGGTADVEIINDDYYDGSKTFTATADAHGNVCVWLLAGDAVTGEAGYDTDTSLSADETVIDGDGVQLDFTPPEETAIASIDMDIPDAIFNPDTGNPWEDSNPLDPAEWTFTADGETIDGFDPDFSLYNFSLTRNGVEYDGIGDEFMGFLAGDYTFSVSTEQTVNDAAYMAAGSADFTIEPLIITVQADQKSATVGGALPEFTLSFSSNSDSIPMENIPNSPFGQLFYTRCFGTTDEAGRYPIYVRMDSTKEMYQSWYMMMEEIYGDSIQLSTPNGVFIVSRHHSSGSGASDDYTITAAAGAGGSISPDGSVSVAEGKDKTFEITPDAGYLIADVLVNGESVGSVTEYTFENVTKDAAIQAEFTWDHPFTDLSKDAWYYDAAAFVLQRGLFNGMSDTAFAPDAPVTRAMFVTLLGRLHDIDEADYQKSSFNDVPAGQWYSAYVEWAAQNNIVEGFGSGTFRPNDEITREQLCAILARYCEYAEIELPKITAPITFADDSQISSWARDHVSAAQMADLIQGLGNNRFEPQGKADRAQVAAILMRLILNVIEG